MTDEQVFTPRQIQAFECPVCGSRHDEHEQAVECAKADTEKITAVEVRDRQELGYPRVFTGRFRTKVECLFAAVMLCPTCEGRGETLSVTADNSRQMMDVCHRCKGAKYVVVK